MHFMAPVNINNNGKASVVNSAHTETIFSQSDNCIDHPAVYASCKLDNQTTKMAPRTVTNGTLIQNSPEKFQKKPINGNCINSINLTPMSSSNYTSIDELKSVTAHDTNGLCKTTSISSSLDILTEALNVTSSMPKTMSTSTFDCPSGQVTSEPLQSFCRMNSAPLDEYGFNDTALRNPISSQRNSVEQEYHNCLSLYNQYVSRLDALQSIVHRLSVRGAQLTGKTILSNLATCDSDKIKDSKDHVRNILETCARELDSDETESSSDEEPSHPSVSSVESFSEHDSRSKRLSSEENWLCSRAAYHSQWHWLLSEIQHAEFALKNLRSLSVDSRHNRRRYRHSPNSDQCSRTVPTIVNNHNKVYRLETNTSVAELLAANSGGSGVVDAEIRCNCRSPETGACVLCLGRIHRTRAARSWSQLAPSEADPVRRALSLDSSIHHKLSTPSDIPPGLIMEVRLRSAAHSPPVHWAIPRPVNIPIPSMISAPPLSPLSTSSMSSEESSPTVSNQQKYTNLRPESWLDETILKKRKIELSDGSSSVGAGLESRRTSQDNLSEACASPGIPSSRITRLPCVDLELPSWRDCLLTSSSSVPPSTPTSMPSTSTPSTPTVLHSSASQLRLHIQTSDHKTPVPPSSDKKPLKLMAVTETSQKEETSDESYLLRHSVEESSERDRVCGFVITGQPQSSRSGRRIAERMAADGGWEYHVNPLLGYPQRHFPLTNREMSIIADEERLEEEIVQLVSTTVPTSAEGRSASISEVPW